MDGLVRYDREPTAKYGVVSLPSNVPLPSCTAHWLGVSTHLGPERNLLSSGQTSRRSQSPTGPKVLFDVERFARLALGCPQQRDSSHQERIGPASRLPIQIKSRARGLSRSVGTGNGRLRKQGVDELDETVHGNLHGCQAKKLKEDHSIFSFWRGRRAAPRRPR